MYGNKVSGVCAIYGRRSKDLDNVGKNVAAQVRDMQQLAATNECVIDDAHVYVDNDVSASRFARKKRTDWLQLRAAIEAGAVQNVFTLWLNRLLRMPGELEWLIDQAQAGRFHAIITETMTLDLRDPNQQMMARNMASQAALEVELLSSRVKRRKDQDRTEGKATHGVVSFGWLGTRHGHANDNGDTLYAPEAALLHDAGVRVLAGVSLSTIAREWNANNVPMPLQQHQALKNGTEVPAPKWMPGHVRRLLMMPRNAGYQTHDGVIVGQPWPAIFNDDEWNRLSLHFKARKYAPRPKRSSRWTGFVRCAGLMPDGSVCGKTMAYNAARGNTPGSFKCGRVAGTDVCTMANSIVEHHAQAKAYAWLPDFLDDDAVSSLVADDDDDDTGVLFAELQRLHQVQEENDALRGVGQMDAAMYARASAANKQRRDELSRLLARTPLRHAMTKYTGRGKLVASLLADDVMEADEHRALFLSTGQYLWVTPAGGRGPFNPARLHIGAEPQRALHTEASVA